MASKRQRTKDGLWEARFKDINGKEKSVPGFATAKQALEYGIEQEALIARDLSRNIDDGNKTLRRFVIENWIPTLNVKRETKQSYELQLNSIILPRFGDMPLREIKRSHIEAWQADLSNLGPNGKMGLGPNTIKRHTHLLSSILRLAFDDGYINKNPVVPKRSRAVKSVTRKVVPFDFNTIKAIADKFPAKWRLLIWLMYYTGLRPSEALGLTYDRIDFQSGEILIDRQLSRFKDEIFTSLKTPASKRTIWLTEPLKVLIEEHVKRFGLGKEGLLFKGRTGEAWRYESASLLFRKATRALGIYFDREGLHNIRHTFVSVAIKNGVAAKRIQAWVGHASITETMDTYGHLWDEDQKELADLIASHAWIQPGSIKRSGIA